MEELNNSNLSVHRDIIDINENLSKTETTFNQEHESVSHETDNNDVQLKSSYCVPNICLEVPEIVPEVLGHPFDNINDEKKSKLIDFNSSMKSTIFSEFANEDNCVEMKDEEFHDAVQFFKDPSAIKFLANAGSSNSATENPLTRSSLYVNFDPLHAKFFPQPNETKGLQNITECEDEPENIRANSDPGNQEISNKNLLSVTPRASISNVLISFDSPATSKNVEPESLPEGNSREPPKLYSEEELQLALKMQELRIQERYLKRQYDLETVKTQKIEELKSKIEVLGHLCPSLHAVFQEFAEFTATLSEQKSAVNDKLENAEKEIIKLKEDLKTTAEDLQSVECSFTDLHKRYEMCKSMLKVNTQNEDNLKRQVNDTRLQLQEKEETFRVLQTRTQEVLDRENTEVFKAKRAGDAQVVVLEAQLKKAELRISSLESHVKILKMEKDKLNSICDDLMTKVSES